MIEIQYGVKVLQLQLFATSIEIIIQFSTTENLSLIQFVFAACSDSNLSMKSTTMSEVETLHICSPLLEAESPFFRKVSLIVIFVYQHFVSFPCWYWLLVSTLDLSEFEILNEDFFFVNCCSCYQMGWESQHSQM